MADKFEYWRELFGEDRTLALIEKYKQYPNEDIVDAEQYFSFGDFANSNPNEVFVDCACENATADVVQLCMDADIPLEVWTVNDKNTVLSLDPYVSGVTSDSLIAGNVFLENSIGG